MNVTRQSILTNAINTLDLPVTQEQLDRFEVRRQTGEYVQTIFPNLPAAEREFILNGITPAEWTEKFGTHPFH